MTWDDAKGDVKGSGAMNGAPTPGAVHVDQGFDY